MKATLRLSLMMLVLAVSSFELQAQITITKETYPYGPGMDTYFTQDTRAGISIPEEGADKTYDYTGLQKQSQYVSISYDGTKNTSFPEATIKEKTFYQVGGFYYRAHRYYAVTDNSFYGVGRTQFDSTHSLVTVTGNADDEIHFPQADIKFPSTRDYLKFPMTYGDAWVETEIQVTQFELTVAAFGLNKTPGTTERHLTNDREVVGYGKLTLNGNDGEPSAPIEVLLVKVVTTRIDSVFVGGAPAPEALLSAFGFTQGEKLVTTTYTYEMLDFGRQPVTINLNANGDVESALFRPDAADVSTGIAPLQYNAAVYPSVLTAGDVLSFDLENNNSPAQVQLVTLQGVATSLKPLGNGQFSIPMNLSPGIYLYQAKNDALTPVATGKLIISQ